MQKSASPITGEALFYLSELKYDVDGALRTVLKRFRIFGLFYYDFGLYSSSTPTFPFVASEFVHWYLFQVC